MPNTGRPSPACHLCRKRRVKCDLDPSGCLRCAKIGATCPGYRREHDLLFHNQDKESFALTLASSRRKKEAAASSQISDEDINTTIIRSNRKASPSSSRIGSKLLRTSVTASKISAPLPLQIAEHWNMYCIPIMLRQFSAPAGSGQFYDYLDFLPDLYRETSAESCLHLATIAIAKAYITNLSPTPLDKKDVVQTYGRALRSTNAALSDPVESVKDSTLIAVWLLGIHELLVSSAKKSLMMAPEAYHMHSEGLLSLLCIRGPCQFSTRRGRNLFWMIYLFIQTHCLVTNKEGPPQSLGWFELLRPQLSEEDQLIFEVLSYNHSISSLCSRVHALRYSCTDQNEFAFQSTSLLTEMDTLLVDIQTWNAESQFQPGGLASIHILNTLRAALLKLQRFAILLISDMMARSLTASTSSHINCRLQQSFKSIQVLTSEIITSIPLVLGDSAATPDDTLGCWADALRLVWPLAVVSWVPSVSPKQREESQQALQRIGRQMGIRFALDCNPPPERFANKQMSCRY